MNSVKKSFGLIKLLYLPLLVFTFGFVPQAYASAADNIYIAQSTAGSANGVSCANAYAVSFFNTATNWGSTTGKIGPGTTVHLCGTISSSLWALGSGVSGMQITVLFEAGAKISMPVCPGRGSACLSINNQNYLTIDGGVNGIIENTANGTNLANHIGSYGVEASKCSNCEIKNLTIQNIYVRTSNSDVAIDQTGVRCANFSGSNFSFHDNTCHDTGWAFTNELTSGMSNIRVYNNNIYNIDHGWVPTASTAGGSYGPLYFYNNHIHDYANWDSGVVNAYHHDGIHCYSAQGTTGGHWNNVSIYNNLFDGNTGANITGHIFLEGGTGMYATPCADSTSTFSIFNNVFKTTQVDYGIVGVHSGSVNIFNNTILGAVPTDGVCLSVSSSAYTIRNNIISGCNQLISTAAGGPPSFADYNLYANCTSYNCWWVGSTDTANFTLYKSATGFDAHGISAISSTAGLDSSAHPQIGSPVIGTAANLTSLCIGDLSPLCNDIAGVSRPISAAWDIGAYQFASSISVTPTPTPTPSSTPTPTPSDTTPPSVSLTSPTSGFTISGSVSLEATASDNTGVTGVQFLLDGIAFTSELTASPYRITWDTTTASDGPHTLTATARDATGNQTTSPEAVVTISNATASTQTPNPTPEPTPTPTTLDNTPTTPSSIHRPLYRGTKGDDVKTLQTLLIQKGHLPPSNDTGFFGLLTRAAVQKYQCSQNIICGGTESSTGYGVAGPKTLARLGGGTVTTPSPSTSNLTPAQADAIISILQSFNADASVIASVRRALGR